MMDFCKKMKKLFCAYLLGFMSLNCYAKENSFETEVLHCHGVGVTSDEYAVFVDVFFSLENIFETNVPKDELRRLSTWVIEGHVSSYLRHYLNNYISQFEARDIHFDQVEIYRGFMEYASDQLNELKDKIDGLISVRIASLEVLENPEMKSNRLRRLERAMSEEAQR